MFAATTNVLKNFAASCGGGANFFAFPHWYEYLPGGCDFNGLHLNVQSLSSIALALVEIALRIAGLVAIGYIVWGGVQFITAQGDPGATKKARQTVINAIIGMIIALIATGVVRLIGGRLAG